MTVLPVIMPVCGTGYLLVLCEDSLCGCT